MSKESSIHIGLGYEEGVKTKKSLLSSQMKILRLSRSVQSYKLYRQEELELKELLYKKIKELKSSLTNLEKSLPKENLPKILRKDNQKKNNIHKNADSDGSIEDQLKEIQKRLEQLQEQGI